MLSPTLIPYLTRSKVQRKEQSEKSQLEDLNNDEKTEVSKKEEDRETVTVDEKQEEVESKQDSKLQVAFIFHC